MNNMFSNLMGMMNQLKTDPVSLLSKRFNLPQNMSKDPNEILNYLVTSGQVSQSQIDQAQQMRSFFQK